MSICAAFVVVGVGLVFSSPERPGHDEGCAERWPQQEPGQEIADLRDGGQQGEQRG